ENAETLGLTGKEKINVHIDENVKPNELVKVTATDKNGDVKEFNAIARFDSDVEIDYYRHGGILQMVLRDKLNAYITILRSPCIYPLLLFILIASCYE